MGDNLKLIERMAEALRKTSDDLYSAVLREYECIRQMDGGGSLGETHFRIREIKLEPSRRANALLAEYDASTSAEAGERMIPAWAWQQAGVEMLSEQVMYKSKDQVADWIEQRARALAEGDSK